MLISVHFFSIAPIVLELIDSIEVSEQYIKDGSKQQDIIINYKFVGNMGRKRIADKN